MLYLWSIDPLEWTNWDTSWVARELVSSWRVVVCGSLTGRTMHYRTQESSLFTRIVLCLL